MVLIYILLGHFPIVPSDTYGRVLGETNTPRAAGLFEVFFIDFQLQFQSSLAREGCFVQIKINLCFVVYFDSVKNHTFKIY